MNVLDTITAKLDRAHEHLQVFDIAVREFLISDPHTYSHQFDPKGGNLYDWVFTIHIHHEIPLRISAIFGDGIQNVRTCLDYLVYQLSIANAGNECDLTGVAFPIFSEPHHYMAIKGGVKYTKGRIWTSSGLYKVRNIATKAQAVIESLQPYHGGDNQILRELQILSDIDKHRHLHMLSRPHGRWEARNPLGDGISPESLEGLTIRNSFFATPPFKDGAEVARFEVAVPPNFDFKVRVQFTIPDEVVLDEIGLPNAFAGHALQGTIGFVRKEVIPQFLPFLK